MTSKQGIDPFVRFRAWLDEAEAKEPNDPNAMALASADAEGRPSVRMVLLRGLDDRGFTFFTNYESRKGLDLAANPRAALLFHWVQLERQVRVEGIVEKVADDESDAYFASRPLGSRVGAYPRPAVYQSDRKLMLASCTRAASSTA